MSALLAVVVAVLAGTAGGVTALAAAAVWATGPTVPGETLGDRAGHAREVVAAVRRVRAHKGHRDPYGRIAYRTDDPGREGVA